MIYLHYFLVFLALERFSVWAWNRASVAGGNPSSEPPYFDCLFAAAITGAYWTYRCI